jgi:hypothetical protein
MTRPDFQKLERGGELSEYSSKSDNELNMAYYGIN